MIDRDHKWKKKTEEESQREMLEREKEREWERELNIEEKTMGKNNYSKCRLIRKKTKSNKIDKRASSTHLTVRDASYTTNTECLDFDEFKSLTQAVVAKSSSLKQPVSWYIWYVMKALEF